MTKRSATAVDRHIGERIRAARDRAGMSQTKLGEAIGVTFQQIQKYERGHNRIAASTLYDLAAALGKPTGWFLPPDRYARPKPLVVRVCVACYRVHRNVVCPGCGCNKSTASTLTE